MMAACLPLPSLVASLLAVAVPGMHTAPTHSFRKHLLQSHKLWLLGQHQLRDGSIFGRQAEAGRGEGAAVGTADVEGQHPQRLHGLRVLQAGGGSARRITELKGKRHIAAPLPGQVELAAGAGGLPTKAVGGSAVRRSFNMS